MRNLDHLIALLITILISMNSKGQDYSSNLQNPNCDHPKVRIDKNVTLTDGKDGDFIYQVNITVNDSGFVKKDIKYLDWVITNNDVILAWNSPGTGKAVSQGNNVKMKWTAAPEHKSYFKFKYIIKVDEKLPESLFKLGTLYWGETNPNDVASTQFCENAFFLGIDDQTNKTVKLIPAD
ncbi:MAG: hypothetical protein MRY83_22275 [Flavobacteriales bacterium]|nr:hypothetical protein [Flavobacteriales bacterium]